MSPVQEMPYQHPRAPLVVVQNIGGVSRHRKRRVQVDDRDPLLIQLPQQVQIRAWKRCLRPLQQNALRRVLNQLLEDFPLPENPVSAAKALHLIAAAGQLRPDIPQQLRVEVLLGIGRDHRHLPRSPPPVCGEIGPAAADPDDTSLLLQQIKRFSDGLPAVSVSGGELCFAREFCTSGAVQLRAKPSQLLCQKDIFVPHIPASFPSRSVRFAVSSDCIFLFYCIISCRLRHVLFLMTKCLARNLSPLEAGRDSSCGVQFYQRFY